jgi:hypothetical protein
MNTSIIFEDVRRKSTLSKQAGEDCGVQQKRKKGVKGGVGVEERRMTVEGGGRGVPARDAGQSYPLEA